MTSANRIGKNLRSKTIDEPRLFRWRQSMEWRLFRRVARAVKPGDKHHVLVAPAGGGNVGDQAMVEAFIENVAGPIVVVARSKGDFTIPCDFGGRVSLAIHSALITGRAMHSSSALAELAQVLDGSSGVSIIGADVLDGAYSYRQSVQRIAIATYASRLGFDTRILGFSWNARPDVRCAEALMAASASGARLYLRDPVSSQRARSAGFKGVVDAADLVFSARSRSGHNWHTELLGLAGPFAVLNVSGLIAQKVDQVDEYIEIVNALRNQGLGIVLLPHVSRLGGDDLPECQQVYRAVGGNDVWLVERLPQPAEVRNLTRAASVVITGRMHLAIMALYNAVPAIALSTQGKVAGLMKLFGSEELVVEPVAGFGEQVTTVLEAVLGSSRAFRTRLADKLPAVRALSAKNFEDIGA